jgi:hypothetical protein
VDGGPVQSLTADLNPSGEGQEAPRKKRWADAVCDNVVRLPANMGDLAAGRHVVKVWRLDDNAVLGKLVLSTVAVSPSYLGARPATA